MKGLINIIVIIAIIYFARKFYLENYTVEGVEKKRVEDKAKSEAIRIRAEEMKHQFLYEGLLSCQGKITEGVFGWRELDNCILRNQAEAMRMDWKN